MPIPNGDVSVAPVAPGVAVVAPELAGLTVIERGAASVTWSSVKRWLDPLAMLMGYGSMTGRTIGKDWEDQWNAVAGGGVEMREGVDENDFVYLETNGGPWQLNGAGHNSFFGFPVGVTTSTDMGNGWHRITATSAWSRVQPENKHLQISADLGAPHGVQTWDVPRYSYRAQSVLTLLRKRGAVGGPDDAWVATCLEALDNAAADPGGGGGRIRWGMDLAGRAWSAWPADLVPAIPDPTFTVAGDPLRRMLGAYADGSATIETIPGDFGDLRVVTYGPGFTELLLTFSRPARLRRRFQEQNAARDQLGGASYNVGKRTRRGWTVHALLDGPSDRESRELDYLDGFLERAKVGELVTIFKGWPTETRRALRARDATVAYDLHYTTQGDADFGRLICRRATDDQTDRAPNWPTGRRARGPWRMQFKTAESGV